MHGQVAVRARGLQGRHVQGAEGRAEGGPGLGAGQQAMTSCVPV